MVRHVPGAGTALVAGRYDVRSLALMYAASGAVPALVVALLVPSLVRPNWLWVLAVVTVSGVAAVAVTVRVGVLDDRQFVVLGSTCMVGMALSASVIADPATTTAIGAMLGVVPAIAASGSTRAITVLTTTAASALAVAVCIDETDGAAQLVAVGAAITVVLVPTVLMASLRSSVAAATLRLEEQADTDPLTSLLNRRGLTAGAVALLDAACTSGVPVTGCLVDIDHFKSVNDQFGHAMGDDVLVGVAQTLRAAAAPDALVARLGGEEFLVLGLAPGMAGVETTILRTLRNSGGVTVSVGVVRCTVAPGVQNTRDTGAALDVVTAAADRALYAAKSYGRNQAAYATTAPVSWSMTDRP
ncbi:GGDEF domain-containing protein [Rhodococcus sp. NBC_00297]|uniref:GGDEF domain-containing protein n=1 Tax=Rhodococcus sp. NBC_00297 TaxID=2976005 RepID=UPI002E2A42D7|nr:GGDEF domain-containing protein [Rhodococcus sp. NBC_00297]